ncbi:MAG: sn-glycerol-3-phosphate ABC transporter ATP-binding protein UgpC [Clostridia bacterium]|nr:sn-glycerol-3-phosphate ABC transporter ATP-binding protein UgpC [Clostridia bacterium]
MSSITLKNISKIYSDGTIAVNDVNLQIENKEFIILVGPSGCGKSTTLRMIAGLEQISKGEMKIGDKVVNDIEPKDRNIAMVFQSYALYPHMTVYKNMAFGLELRKIPKDEIDKRVKEAAKILDIEHLLKRKPKALSGGQRQRVALGRAMVRSPDVFLLDEPLSNLDAKLRTAMRTEIIKLHKRLETTFVYVTHDQTEAMTMGDRIVVMKDGIVQQVDTPKNLYNSPCNLFVAGFIGSPGMNFIPCEFDGKNRVRINGSTITVTQKEQLEAMIKDGGDNLTLGIRPEDLTVDSEFIMKHPDSVFEAQVDVVEPLGSETFLYLDFFGTKIIARVSPDVTFKQGEIVKLGINTQKVHIFDTSSGENILTLN